MDAIFSSSVTERLLNQKRSLILLIRIVNQLWPF